MALTTVNPGNFENPDTGQPGSIAVTTPSNTGHASSTASASGGSAQSKSCRWFAFPSVPGVTLSATLKIDHTSSGALSGAGDKSNGFRLQYSLNNGGSWTDAVLRTNFTTSDGPTTFSFVLPIGQDLTQVQIRDFMEAVSDVGNSASASATIANIKIEVVTQDSQPVVLW